MKRILCLLLCLPLLLCGCGAAQETTSTIQTTSGTTAAPTMALTTPAPKATTTVAPTTTTVTTVRPTTVTTATTTTTTTTTATTTTTRPTTPPKPEPLRVLSIGNSLSKDAHSQLAMLAEFEGRELYTLNLFHSGCTLKQHVSFWQKGEAAYWVEENGDSRTLDWNKKVRLMDVLPVGTWDIITIQEGVSSSCNYETMLENGKKLQLIIKSHQPKAKVFIHQTWALADGNQYHTEETGGTFDSMWVQMEENYNRLSQDLGLPLIPAGKAMYDLQKAYDQRGLGESIHRDGLHADEGWGCFCVALVWYRTLTGEIPSSDFDLFKGPYIEDPVTRKLVYDTAMAAVDAYDPE